MTASISFAHEGNLQDAYIELVKNPELWRGDINRSLEMLLSAATGALGVKRAGIWKLAANDQSLQCDHLCGVHQCQSCPYVSLAASEHRTLFAHLENERIIAAIDAQHHPATCSLSREYLAPNRIASVLIVGIRSTGNLTGALCFEHGGSTRDWSSEEQQFATSIGDLLAQIVAVHALCSSEDRYRQVFDCTGDAVIVSRDNIMVDCNQSALALFGCSQEEFYRNSPLRFWAEHQTNGQPSKEAAKPLNAAAIAGQNQFFRWRHRRFNGQEFDAEVCLSSIELNNVPHLVASIRDISERTASEAKIQDLLTLQQAIFDGAPYAIIATDLTGTIRSFNRAAQTLLGYDVHDIVGRAVPTLFHDSDELNWRAIELSEELNQTFEPGFSALIAYARLGKTEKREWNYVRKDQQRIPVMVTVAPLRQGGTDVSGYLIMAADLSERKQADEQLLNSRREMEHRANHDDLTGLPNRSRLHDMTYAAIVSARAKKHHLALMLIDLDRFKEVNDTLGHAIGDKLLKIIARKLNDFLGANGCQLYRLGGDEFAVLMPLALDEKDAQDLALKVHERLREPISIEDITLELGGSIGISYFPTHGDNSHALLRCADVAMYKAKSESAGMIMYHPENDTHSPRRLSMMAELGTAIRENQLVLHYQPRISLAKHYCLGCEALVRWQHPRLGMVPPGEFIPLAEMSDLIQPLGLWVLENAIGQIKTWQDQGLDLVVSINLSTRNLMDYAFPSHIERLLTQYGVPADKLEIEITESTLIGDPDRALHVIDRIHKLGVRFAIDDFGTGYSSLSYLKRLPIDTLKIDRSFIRDMLADEQDAVIVRSTLGLAHSFGLTVVAEGVEDDATLLALRELHCEQAQGFLISRPVPNSEFVSWLHQFKQGNPELH